MSFLSMMTDTIELLKRDGSSVKGIKASVQRSEITTFDCSVLIEPHDLIIRHASNGAKETYEVIDPEFHEEFHGIPASYQIKVRKLGVPEAKREVQNITFNVSGTGARVNHNSVDSSVNTITVNAEVFSSLEYIREEIEKAGLSSQQREEAFELIDELKEQFGSGKPKRTIVSALLKALPSIATISKSVSAIAASF
ncbi:hypothetical protein ACI2KC_04470 [Pseudomonas monteilii]